MADKIHFTKMQGAGNDYIYVDTSLYTVSDPVKAAIEWSDRHKGIGADGLVLIGRSEIPDLQALQTHPSPPYEGGSNYHEISIRLLTLSGVKTLILQIVDGKVEKAKVDMGEPVFEDESLFNSAKEKSLTTSLPSGGIEGGFFVSMGNPHYVIFVDDIQAVDVAKEGKRLEFHEAFLEFHEAFPERCNIEFAQVTAPNIIRTRVWERGSGITMACGTGACATAVASAMTGRCDRKSSILMDGGQLDIEWRTDNHVLLSGPAEFVFEGEIYESEE